MPVVYVRVRREDGREFDFPDGAPLGHLQPVKGYPKNFSGQPRPPKDHVPMAADRSASNTAGKSAEKGA